jgi:molybdopterin-guanine dinucleotide biosynthesis protein
MPIPIFEGVTGAAGTGKTTLIRQRIADFKAKGVKNYGILTATTGIAAINLSGASGDTVTTINSELGYFDTNSLKDNYASRRLHAAIKRTARKGKNIIIDEVSMMDAEQLDIIYNALYEVNDLAEVSNRGGLGLILVFDFCQLPPVNAEFAFNAKCWNKIKITKLEKIWRQNDKVYLDMLNSARCGDGLKTANLLCSMESVTLTPSLDSHFDGTTIVPVNKLVDSINKIRLDELIIKGAKSWEFRSFRWGRQLGEWKNIPESRVVAKGAYVMILANDAPTFSYANGSCGYIENCDISTGSTDIILANEQKRQVKVRKVTRCNYTKETPEGFSIPDVKVLSKDEWNKQCNPEGLMIQSLSEDTQYHLYLKRMTEQFRKTPTSPYYSFNEEKWVIGEVTYSPVRLAYAATVHKTQGLSLDKIQIDYSHAFFGEPSMSYVALSRCRTPEGLTVVGNKKLIENRTNISSEILEWI